MILGSIIVSNQQPDWVEASPKKFAWILGVILGFIMSYFILFDIMTPARLLTCLLCLVLLYLEAVFGICLGCIIYKKLNVKLYKCPGGVCEIPTKKDSLIPKFFMLLLFAILFYGVYYGLKTYKYHGTTSSNLTQEQIDDMEFDEDDSSSEDENQNNNTETKQTDTKCKAPQWAIDMGHEDRWLKHHGCL
jgi:hypothetical protein